VNRFRDILKGTVLASRISFIIDEAQNNWLRELGKNDFLHSKSVEMILDRLVPDELKTNQDVFDHGEIFLLLIAIYLHDIGHRLPTLHHEIESYNIILRDPEKFHLCDEFEAKAVAQICAAHSQESVWPIEKCDKSFGIAALTSSGRTFNLQRLGALLRIADELDNTYIRVRGIVSEEGSVRQIIRDINPIPKKGIIEIQAQPRTWEDWELLIKIREYSQRRLREVMKYIEDIGLEYYQIWLQPENFTAPLKLPESTTEYQDLIQAVAVLSESRFASVDILTKFGDCEIPIICTDKRLGVSTKTAFFLSPTLTISIAYEFRGALSYLREQMLIQNGVVVVQKPPSEDLLNIIKDPGFYLYTLSELVLNLYDFESAVDSYIKRYEKQDIFLKDLYIKMHGSLETGEEIENLEDYVLSWCDSPSGVHLTILGDFGSGKTTFCERVVYLSAKKYKDHPDTTRVPILVKLKDIGSMDSIESVITDKLVNELGIDLKYRTFEALNKTGRFLLVLDGFDEVPHPLVEKFILRVFQELDKLVEQNSKVILTCRTHFFKDNKELRKIYEGSALYDSISKKFGYELLFIDPFGKAQIDEYLIRWDSDRYSYYKNTIESVYHLADLATRPVLLNIIVKTIPQLDKGNVKTINVASLYQVYIRFWLERDDWRSELNPTERKTLAESLSSYMFLKKISRIHYAELPSLLKKWTSGMSEYQEEVLDYELRTCNFIRRDHIGHYSFVHKSFMEYFLASMLVKELFEGNKDLSLDWYLPIEVDEGTVYPGIIASKEIQDFVLQLADIKLREFTSKLLCDSFTGKLRSQILIAKIIRNLNLRDYGVFYSYLIIDHRFENQGAFLAGMILRSNDCENSISYLTSLIQEDSDVDHIANILGWLNDEALEKDQLSCLASLEEKVKDIELKYDDRSRETLDQPEDYPYTRANRRIKLEETLSRITDSVELANARKEFYRKWSREKSDYDKQLKRKQQLERQAAEEEFLDDLKKRKEKHKSK